MAPLPKRLSSSMLQMAPSQPVSKKSINSPSTRCGVNVPVWAGAPTANVVDSTVNSSSARRIVSTPGCAEYNVSISSGNGWSPPVNVTNNVGRQSFSFKQTGLEANVLIERGSDPGPAAAAFDLAGHLLLVMVDNEYGTFATTAFNLQMSGGGSRTPTLKLLRP
jgi:hypothetical protein